jgi:peptidoglycan/LPS O-acetylase OafA/YrhL
MKDGTIGGPATPNTVAISSGGRIHELDALRGIAALGVVVWHYGAHFGSMPFRLALFPFYNAGFLFVDFFFVLSGYVIARAFWREPRQSRLGANIVARLARMYPLHLLTLLLVAILLACLPVTAQDPDFVQPANDAWHFLLNLLLLNQSGLQDGWSFNTPAWSISTEFIVNVAFLSFIYLDTRGRLLSIILAATAAAAMLVLSPRPYIDGQFAFGWLDVNLLRCSLGFTVGIAVYWLAHRLGAARVLARHPLLCTAGGTASLAALFGVMILSGRHPPLFHYVVSIAMASGCVLWVPFAPALRSALRVKPLTYLGDISYSTYLVHYPLQLAIYLAGALGLVRLDFSSPITFIGFIAAVIVISAATHRFIEMPGQKRLLEFSPPLRSHSLPDTNSRP